MERNAKSKTGSKPKLQVPEFDDAGANQEQVLIERLDNLIGKSAMEIGAYQLGDDPMLVVSRMIMKTDLRGQLAQGVGVTLREALQDMYDKQKQNEIETPRTDLICQWAEDHGLFDKVAGLNYTTQVGNLMAAVGSLSMIVQEPEGQLVVEALAKTMTELTILTKMFGLPMHMIACCAWEQVKDRHGTMIGGRFVEGAATEPVENDTVYDETDEWTPDPTDTE